MYNKNGAVMVLHNQITIKMSCNYLGTQIGNIKTGNA